MKIFINEKPVKLIAYDSGQSGQGYDTVLGRQDEIISKRLLGNVLVQDATSLQIERLIRLMHVKSLKKMKSLTFAVADLETMKQFFKDQFTIIKASGGLVRKGDRVLMIYRLKKWDLPKGKLKKKEESLKGAKREVEEECSIKVEVKEKLCSTWHTYLQKGKRILKKTDWYVMNCIDDSDMKPQAEEFIEDVKWMKKEDVQKSLKNSYGSIDEVVSIYYSLQLDLVR